MNERTRMDKLEAEIKELRGQFAALLAFMCEDEDPAVDEAARWQQAHERAKARRKKDMRDS